MAIKNSVSNDFDLRSSIVSTFSIAAHQVGLWYTNLIRVVFYYITLFGQTWLLAGFYPLNDS